MMKTTETGNNKFVKQIGGTTYIVRFHYSEQARETMQEKINRMLQNEVRQLEPMEPMCKKPEIH